ncbi:unnamed protein product [Arabidopsis thaliana]|uniref:Small acidic protein 2 n=3 Tax=Arabidopsis TaxID=3701 RepID=SMAP2_ARATH|nr:small acidic protein 2 [Arabidopsis thaliana]Q1ECS0.1 RecName: Full=Small acidic protein 2 [Arabidopsis thaliana]KAG7632404.1 hypothetical protein ISN44_As03g025450 [Arabidopsis suecica]ABF74696.1 At3g24280 [Arabidopsis thaliana]AEE76884.1 small acidic protein 2 [Arabidopsis thaliana]CAA0383530.1 unnamed protein product [Arabidopsis thaliana]CAD5324009.1 unnamed protein product [Arabidopsis thaliana]|eukprot:NP_189071.1 small acidic protein 2 [Arabidopsis thaliana]
MDRYWEQDPMRPMVYRDFLGEMEYPGYSMPMQMEIDEDDFGPMDMQFEVGGISPFQMKPEDSDFFNKFEDDFDDSDIN